MMSGDSGDVSSCFELEAPPPSGVMKSRLGAYGDNETSSYGELSLILIFENLYLNFLKIGVLGFWGKVN